MSEDTSQNVKTGPMANAYTQYVNKQIYDLLVIDHQAVIAKIIWSVILAAFLVVVGVLIGQHNSANPKIDKLNGEKDYQTLRSLFEGVDSSVTFTDGMTDVDPIYKIYVRGLDLMAQGYNADEVASSALRQAMLKRQSIPSTSDTGVPCTFYGSDGIYTCEGPAADRSIDHTSVTTGAVGYIYTCGDTQVGTYDQHGNLIEARGVSSSEPGCRVKVHP